MSMLQLHGTKIKISREGLVSVWRQYYVDSDAAVADVPDEINSLAGSSRLELVEVNSVQAEEGIQQIVTAQYEGAAGESRRKKTYDWVPEEKEEPIIINPNIKDLWTRYEASWDAELQDIKWPRMIKAGKGGKEVENPMTGTTSWLDLFGTWSETEIVQEIDEDILSGTWELVDSVPGPFPTPRNRMWLVLPPEVQSRGACFEIKRRWRLTGVMTTERLEAAKLIYTPVK
jgi:hypothetical protein